MAAGLAIDVGGPLSHGAIVAREMGAALRHQHPHRNRALRTGDVVRLDGARRHRDPDLTDSAEGAPWTTPIGVEPIEDYTHAIPGDVELWSENYFFGFYDPRHGVGLWNHLGRTPHDPTMWRGLITAFLPDGRMAVSKTYGRGPAEPGVAGPSNGTLAFRCEDPLLSWTVAGDAMARPTTLDALAAAPVSDGEVVPLSFEYRFDAHHPDVGPRRGGHVQPVLGVDPLRAGRARSPARLRYGDQEWELAGTGMRDHSYGPRNFAHFRRGSWVHAEFPSGRTFVALRMWSNDDAGRAQRGDHQRGRQAPRDHADRDADAGKRAR